MKVYILVGEEDKPNTPTRTTILGVYSTEEQTKEQIQRDKEKYPSYFTNYFVIERDLDSEIPKELSYF